MNQKELKDLIDYLIEKDISEFELERGDVKVRIKRGAEAHAPQVVPHIVSAVVPAVHPLTAPASHSASTSTPPAAAPVET